LDHAAFALGPRVQAFEESFASAHGSRFCIGVNSGTSALHLALLAHGVGPGDDVVVPAMTFVSTAWAVSYCGATPVFCDVRPDTATLCPDALTRSITERTKAVIPVHLYGQPCDMAEIAALCEKRGLILIEDCAQAHSAEYRGKRVGTFGHAGCFSFYPGKNLGAYGEAGAVVTNDESAADTIRMLRDHAQPEKHRHVTVGYNYRMEGIQGAVLKVKLEHIESWTEARRRVAENYREGLRRVVLPVAERDRRHVYHLFVVRHPERDRLMRELAARGVHCGLHYPRPLHLQEAYGHLGYGKTDLPASEAWADECLSLPIFPEMTEREVDHVVASVNELA
jgi:dTDP-4-amino-4,6-dideoxygalactose transaminase